MAAFVTRFIAFWYDFVVGDDWLVAVGTIVALVLGGAAARSALGSIAWLIVPLCVVVVLTVSLLRAARAR